MERRSPKQTIDSKPIEPTPIYWLIARLVFAGRLVLDTVMRGP